VGHAIACRSDIARAPFVTKVRQSLRDVMRDLTWNGTWAGATVIGPLSRSAGFTEYPEMEDIE
jgi:hypothetical protein